MGQITLSILICSLLAFPATAQQGGFIRSSEGFEIPEKAEVLQGGFAEAPVLPCPRPAKKYSDLLAQLNEIKVNIQNQACTDSNIKVESLETLVTDDREKFVELIEKGVFGEGQLNDSEVATVKEYVTNVVNYTGNLAGLVKNSACFDDEQKESTLSFLSNVISEVSGAVGALAGPWGAQISLGGQVAGALLSSIDKIVQARKTYDYDKSEDINNYFNNLCTYYDFKADLDKESNLFVHRERLLKVLEQSGEYINRVVQTCEVCELITEDYLTRLDENAGYDLNRVSRVVPPVVSSEFGNPKNSPISPYVSEPGLTAADVSLTDMNAYYAEAYATEMADSYPPVVEPPEETEPVGLPELDTSSFTPRPVTYVAPPVPQEATIRALQIRNWAIEEIKIVETSIRNGMGEDGRLSVAKLQREIESFLVDKEAPDYIRHKSRDLKKKIAHLLQLSSQLTRSFFVSLTPNLIPRDPNFNYDYNYRDSAGPIKIAFHDLFREDYDFASVLIDKGYKDGSAKESVERRVEIKRNLVQALSDMIDSLGVLQRKCEFFTSSSLSDHKSITYACDKAQASLDEGRDIAKSLSDTSFAQRNSFTLSLVYEKRPNYVRDWVDSVKYALQRDLEVLN